MKEVLLTTLFSGFNYGSSLQTFATKTIIEELGFSCKLVSRKSLIRGRDVRFGKLLTILFRTVFTLDTKTIDAYRKSFSKKMIGDSESRFQKFEETYLSPTQLSWQGLRHYSSECTACIAGSDQIWDSTSLYVDPIYYLRFAPPYKRISFCTSFGHNYVSSYNLDKIKKWISQFECISVREESGVKLIKDLCNREAVYLLDPTLLIKGEYWRDRFGIRKHTTRYILAYFLDPPSNRARKYIDRAKRELGCEVVGIPYQHTDMSYVDKIVATGPIDFLELVDNAEVVITDSFHGTAFSINLHTPFFVFNRNNGAVHTQNERIFSILNCFKLERRFEPNDDEFLKKIDFNQTDIVLDHEINKAKKYLLSSLEKCLTK